MSKKEETAVEFGNSNINAAPNTSKGFFSSSTKEKFAYVFSKDFIIILLLGQFLSFCITTTIVTSQQLAEKHQANFPTAQNFLVYVVLNIIFTPLTIYKIGFNGWIKMIKKRWWKYLILAVFDVEANYFVVRAYQYTSILSIMLLDTWTIPCVVILSIIFLKVRYHWSQYLAVLICLVGIAALIVADFDSGRDMHTHSNLILGDIFCLISATGYAVSNVWEEYLIKQRPFWEVVGQLSFYGTIICGVQFAILDREELVGLAWNGQIVGLLIAYTIAMLFIYTGAPLLFRLASATFFNLSLLTSDFYSLLFARYALHAADQIHKLYPVAFVGTMLGLTVYNIYPATQPVIKPDKDEDEEQRY